MKLPRALAGRELAAALGRLGYVIVRQTGSHIRLTASAHFGEHHVTIPSHDALRVGTLAGILNEVAKHFRMSRDEVMDALFEGRHQ